MGKTVGTAGQRIRLHENKGFQDNAARSIMIHQLSPRTVIRLYDGSEADLTNDWLEIEVLESVESYCVGSFEESFNDDVIRATFSQVDGLDGEVSFMAVNRTPAEFAPIGQQAVPAASATATVSHQPTQTGTPTPAIQPIPEAECVPTGTEREFATVSRVIDGESIDVTIDGVGFRIRYIGVDSPEPGDPYFGQSRALNQDLVGDQTVTLVRDSTEVDDDGFLMRYVMVGNSFVNYTLVREGLATIKIVPPDVACSIALTDAQKRAVGEGAGLWASISEPPSSTGTPSPMADVQISFVSFEGSSPGSEPDEFVQITNVGSTLANLEGWRLNAGSPGEDYVFPAFVLDPGLSCRIYTDSTHPEHCGFSFRSGMEVWNNDGDCAYLYDVLGAQVSKYCYRGS